MDVYMYIPHTHKLFDFQFTDVYVRVHKYIHAEEKKSICTCMHSINVQVYKYVHMYIHVYLLFLFPILLDA